MVHCIAEASALTLFCFMFTFAVLQLKETLAIRMPYSQDFTLRKSRQTSLFFQINLLRCYI